MTPTSQGADNELSQDSRALRITTPLADGALLVTRFSGTEGISRPFRFELELLSESDDVAFDELLGASATVTAVLPNTGERCWNGVITRFSQNGRDDNFSRYSATLEPAIHAMGLRSDCRVFQAKKVDEILDGLLSGYETKKAYLHEESRTPRNYCVQYRESDLSFFSRLIEEYGLLYYFEHAKDKHTLVLADDSTQLAKIDGLDPVDYCEVNEGDGVIKQWAKTQQITATGASLYDVHHQRAGVDFSSEKDIAESVTLGSATHQLNPDDATNVLFDYPAGCGVRHDLLAKEQTAADEEESDSGADDATPQAFTATENDVNAEAQIRADLLANQAIQITGVSDVLQFTPGGVFTLNGHFSSDADYLLTTVRHVITLGVGVNSAPADDTLRYENHFACLPPALPFRTPRITPKPVIHGVQSAWVVADLEANVKEDPKKVQLIDQYGRVKVRFPWDRRDDAPADGAAESQEGDATDETAAAPDRSCWVRVAQFWAGRQWGAFFWPRHGHEVLVAFEHGDPDRPVIVGSLYNSQNMPPVELPLNAPVCGIKSCSVGGNPQKDSNSITFFDKLGNEHLDLHSEGHTLTITEESHHSFVNATSVRVFGGRSRLVGSGAGGGPSPVANAGGLKSKITEKYRNIGLAKNFEADIEVTLGNAVQIVGGAPCGSLSESVFGGKLEMCIDPMGWLDDGVLKQLQQLMMPTGEWSALFGQGRSLHYGAETSIRHGSEINRRSQQPFDEANPRTHLVGGIVTASAALTLLGFLSQNENPVIWENLVRALGPRGVSGALANLLIEYEKAFGETDAGLEKQNESACLTDHANALTPEAAALVLQLAGSAADQGAALAAAGESDSAAEQAQADAEDNSVDDAENSADEDDSDADAPDDGADAPPTSDPSDQESDAPDEDQITFGEDDANVYQCYDGLLSTGARHISLRARAAEDDDSDPSLILLDAHGGDDQDNGVVAINSTGQASIVCGPASLQIRRDGDTGNVDISAGAEGTITLSVGAAGAGAMISMTSDGIKLSVGADGGPCLELTTSGVTMSCGGNQVAVDESGQTTTGTNISHSADMSYEAKGTMVSVEGSGQTTVKGAVTMIN